MSAHRRRLPPPLLLLLLLLLPWGKGKELHAQFNTDHVMIMGRNALYYEDYVLAIQRFNWVIGAKPFLTEPYFYRGLAKFYLEDYAGAEADCSQAIDRNPYTENYYVLRGLCRVNRQHYAEAETDYRKATDINPMNSSSWHNMVLCQLEQKAYERADSSLDVMIRQWAKTADNYTLKAQIRFAQSDTLNALDWVDRALAVDAYDGQAWSMRAMVTLSRGNYAQGEEELDKAILALPRNANLYINRALARYNRQNLRGAMSDYDAALEMEPGNYLGHFNRGLLRAQVGDDNLAIEDFNFVLQQEPDNMIALYNRALLLDNTGDYRGAIRDISAVIKEYPEFWAGYSTRAAIRRKIGDVYGAERDEFKVLKAEMEKRTGTYRSKTKTRKKSERDPSQYDKLVEEDTQTTEKETYASEYRGRVQDRTTDLVPEPMFVLTYYRRDAGIKSYIPYHKSLESLNVAGVLPFPLYLSNMEVNADETRRSTLFADLQTTEQALQTDSLSRTLSVRRALDAYHLRDFSSALDDLDRTLRADTTNALAYFLRAQIRFAQLQVDGSLVPASLSMSVRLSCAQVLDDLARVITLMPDMVYAHYNRGNVLLALREYAQAEQAYGRALELDPRFPDAYYNRGVARLLDGQREPGLSDLSQAGEYGLYSAYSLIKRYAKEKK